MSGEDQTLLFDRSKLVIITLLAAAESLTFAELLEKSGFSTGNLSSHLSKLEAKKLVKIKKTFNGKRPLTTVEITDQGRTELKNHIRQLKQILGNI